MTTTDSITTSPQAPKPPKRHRVRNTVLIISTAGIAAIIGASAAGGSTPAASTPAASSPPASSAPWDSNTLAPSASSAPAAPAPTVAQEQALDAAKSYLDMGGFSKAGLIEQLTSSAGEGFEMADARWAVRHAHADWNEQAVESAKSYLDMGGFSRESLIEQLTSSAGEQFTLAQATYAADQVGL